MPLSLLAPIDQRSNYVPSARSCPAIESHAGNARTARKVISKRGQKAGGCDAALAEPGGRRWMRCRPSSRDGWMRSGRLPTSRTRQAQPRHGYHLVSTYRTNTTVSRASVTRLPRRRSWGFVIHAPGRADCGRVGKLNSTANISFDLNSIIRPWRACGHPRTPLHHNGDSGFGVLLRVPVSVRSIINRPRHFPDKLFLWCHWSNLCIRV